MAKSVSDKDILIWLSAFAGVQSICMFSLLCAIEYMKDHGIDTGSLIFDLVIMFLCGATCVLIAIILSPFAWYYKLRKTETSPHRAEMQDMS